MNKKVFSSILAALLVAPTLLACSDSEENAGTGAGTAVTEAAQTQEAAAAEEIPPEEEEGYLDDLPEITFDGSGFMIYNANELSNTWWLTNYVNFAEDSADALESAIFRRNRLVEDRFDILISEQIQPTGVIKEVIAAGDKNMDLCLLKGSDSFTMTQNGGLYDQR